MNNTLVVKNIQGKEIEINVIDIIEDTELDKSYICYTTSEDDIVFISRLVETEDSYSLEDITEEEKKNIEAVMNEDVDGE